MDDFLAARRQINTPRKGRVEPRPHSEGGSPFGELRAEVKSPSGKIDPKLAPEIETVVANGRIRRIHIHCKCGEEIILHCEYPQS